MKFFPRCTFWGRPRSSGGPRNLKHENYPILIHPHSFWGLPPTFPPGKTPQTWRQASCAWSCRLKRRLLEAKFPKLEISNSSGSSTTPHIWINFAGRKPTIPEPKKGVFQKFLVNNLDRSPQNNDKFIKSAVHSAVFLNLSINKTWIWRDHWRCPIHLILYVCLE